jgi:hypothetical protein
VARKCSKKASSQNPIPADPTQPPQDVERLNLRFCGITEPQWSLLWFSNAIETWRCSNYSSLVKLAPFCLSDLAPGTTVSLPDVDSWLPGNFFFSLLLGSELSLLRIPPAIDNAVVKALVSDNGQSEKIVYCMSRLLRAAQKTLRQVGARFGQRTQ